MLMQHPEMPSIIICFKIILNLLLKQEWYMTKRGIINEYQKNRFDKIC